MNITPTPADKFTFGLWTVGNLGRDPFGNPVRPPRSPVELVHLLAEVGAYGVNFHDNDLVPIDATPAERAQIVRAFQAALTATGLVVPMATTNLFTDPAFKDGAFTSNDPAVRAYALQKTMRAIDLGVECGAQVYVFWGGREGVESDAAKDPLESLKRYREALNFLCAYVTDQGYDLRFALEPKPNEPRGDIYLATVGAALAFIETLDQPALVGVNPEVAHETMAGLNVLHAVAQAWDAGKLFHIDLNDQVVGRYDQDFRFGAVNLKAAFFLVKFLEEVGYDGARHFDAHAYRTEDYAGVKDFARGCMRTYLILKEKARQWNADAEIQALVQEINAGDQAVGRYDQDFRFGAVNLKAAFFLVKFLEEVGYDGARHFDAHAYRTEDYAGVKDFARGCMRTYLILKEKARQWTADAEIQALVQEINAGDHGVAGFDGGYSPAAVAALTAHPFDRQTLGARGLPYERLDQLTVELLLGVR